MWLCVYVFDGKGRREDIVILGQFEAEDNTIVRGVSIDKVYVLSLKVPHTIYLTISFILWSVSEREDKFNFVW